MRFSARTVCVAATGLVGAVPEMLAQRGASPNPDLVARRDSIERALEAVAIVDRKLMIPMRDGVRMATDVYRPKDTVKKVPVVFVRTPYNFNSGTCDSAGITTFSDRRSPMDTMPSNGCRRSRGRTERSD